MADNASSMAWLHFTGFEKVTTDKAPGGTLKPAENVLISYERM